MPIASAARVVAIRNTSYAGNTHGSPVATFCKNDPYASSHISRSLFELSPSVPMPTLAPRSSNRATETIRSRLHVALRIIHDGNALPGQDLHIRFGQVDAMHRQRAVIENTEIA